MKKNKKDEVKGAGEAKPPPYPYFCKRCRNGISTRDVGKCEYCGEYKTSSGMFKYCYACARKLGRCTACGTDIDAVELQQWAALSRKARERWMRENP